MAGAENTPLSRFLLSLVIILSILQGDRVFARSPDFLALSERPFWIRLGHYEKSVLGKIFGYWRSGLDGDSFFISQDGKTSPRAELEATWRALDENAHLKFKTPWGEAEGKARCFFPARAALLERETAHQFPNPPCPEYEAWIKKISGKSVSLIFSSYFSGAPASMFGHSFLRISKTVERSREQSNERSREQHKESQNPLLDMAVDYSAETRGENRIIEAFKGLMGFYPGRYGLWPYYVKVKEYNNSENRDLFEYPLHFSPEETEILLAHIWELSFSYSDYYFFHRNCSYQLLTALKVAKPNWKFDAYRVFAVPIDTIRDVLRQPGLAVLAVEDAPVRATYRQSLSEKLKQSYDRLSQIDQELYAAYSQDERQSTSYATEIKSAPLAETLALYFLVKQMQSKGELPEPLRLRHRELLVQRASLGPSSAVESVREPVSPEQGHSTSSVSIGGKISRQRSEAITLKWRPALHDLLNDDAGYNPFSRLEIFTTEVGFRPASRRFALENLTVLAITSLSPIHKTQFKWSYAWDLYGEQARGLGCSDCLLWGAAASAGVSIGVPSAETGLIYSMVVVEAQAASPLDRGWRLGPGLTLGGVWKLSNWAKVTLKETAQIWALDRGRITSKSELGFSVFPEFSKGRDWEVRSTGSVVSSWKGRTSVDQTVQFSLTRFF